MPRQVGFRCPDDILLKIENHAEKNGIGRSAAILQLIEGMPSIVIEHRKNLPEIEAVYIVWAGSELLYIGQAQNLKKRFTNHNRLLQFLEANANVSWFDTQGYARLDIEASLITAFTPALNKTPNPGRYETSILLSAKTRIKAVALSNQSGISLEDFVRKSVMEKIKKDSN